MAAGMNTSFSGYFFSAGSAGFTIFQKILSGINKVKSDTNSFGKLLTITSVGMDLYQQSRKITSFNTAIRLFGTAGAVYDAYQICGTIDFLAKRVISYNKTTVLFDEKNTLTEFITEVSFGVANLGSSLLWMNKNKLIDLGRYTVQSIGGVAVGTFTLAGAVTGGVVVGFAALSFNALKALNGDKELTADEKKSHLCTVAWSVTEIALIVIPAVGIAPAAPWMAAGVIFAKAAGIGSFMYGKN